MSGLPVTVEAPSLLDMAQGFFRGKVLCAAVRLGVADALGDQERSLDELVAATASDRDALYRLLRALASIGVVAQVSASSFRLTEFGRPLRRDVSDSAWAMVVFWADLLADSWTYLADFVKAGDRAGVAKVLEAQGVKSRWAMEPDPRAIFHAAFGEIKADAMDPFAAAYPFPPQSVIADLGCGGGGLVAAILARHPDASAILVDRDAAVGGAMQLLAASGAADRASAQPGDLLDAVPRGASIYTMQFVLHGYDDETARRILENVRAAMNRDGRLLVIETVLPTAIAEPDATVEKLMMADINMLAVTGGRERSEEEWRTLLGAAGFGIRRVIPVAGAQASIIECAQQ